MVCAVRHFLKNPFKKKNKKNKKLMGPAGKKSRREWAAPGLLGALPHISSLPWGIELDTALLVGTPLCRCHHSRPPVTVTPLLVLCFSYQRQGSIETLNHRGRKYNTSLQNCPFCCFACGFILYYFTHFHRNIHLPLLVLQLLFSKKWPGGGGGLPMHGLAIKGSSKKCHH
jgi:hypothetical protein